MCVQDAPAAVRALLRERERCALAIERRAPLDQLLDRRGTFFDQRVHGTAVAQAVTRRHGVLLVQIDFIVIAERNGDATLGVFRGRFVQGVLGNNQHLARLRQFDGRAQTGHTGADNEEIRIHPLSAILASAVRRTL